MQPQTRRLHEESWWHGRDVLVHEVIAEVAAAFPQCAAVEVVTDAQLRTSSHLFTSAGQGPEVFTYAALHSMAMRLANVLRRSIAGHPEDEAKVVVLVDEGVGLVVCELAVLMAGGAFVPIDPNWPPQRLAFIVRDCDARVLLLPRVAAHSLPPKLAEAGLQLGTEHLALVWEDALQEAAEPAARAEAEPLPPPRGHTRRADRCSHVVYTSGTSGQPKGVVCEHAGLLAYMHAKASPPAHCLLSHPLAEPDESQAGAGRIGGVAAACGGRVERVEGRQRPSRVLITAASSWDPSLGDIFSALAAGAVVCLAPRGAVQVSLGDVVHAARPTHICSTPALWATVEGGPEAADGVAETRAEKRRKL